MGIAQYDPAALGLPAWNAGREVGVKKPLKQRQIWAIRFFLDREGRMRDRALFDLAIDSKLRGCDLVKIKIGTLVWGRHIKVRMRPPTIRETGLRGASTARNLIGSAIRYCEFRFIGVDNEDRENFGGLRIAGISTDLMVVTGYFDPIFAGLIDRHFTVVELALDLALDDGSVDECTLGVGMRRVMPTWPILDEHAAHALAWHVGEGVVEDHGDFGVMRFVRRGGRHCNQCRAKQKGRELSHHASPSLLILPMTGADRMRPTKRKTRYTKVSDHRRGNTVDNRLPLITHLGGYDSQWVMLENVGP